MFKVGHYIWIAATASLINHRKLEPALEKHTKISKIRLPSPPLTFIEPMSDFFPVQVYTVLKFVVVSAQILSLSGSLFHMLTTLCHPLLLLKSFVTCTA